MALDELTPTVHKLRDSIDGQEQVPTPQYLDAYRHVCEFLNLLGMVFQFVTRDVSDKISIIQIHLDKNSDTHQTLQGMVQYEVRNNLTKVKSPTKSASRTLLRLHRALEFIALFLNRINESAEKDTPSALAGQAYEETLSKHHPFLVRQSVRLALRALPARTDFLNRLVGADNLSQANHSDLASVVTTLQHVHTIIEALYTKEKLHALP